MLAETWNKFQFKDAIISPICCVNYYWVIIWKILHSMNWHIYYWIIWYFIKLTDYLDTRIIYVLRKTNVNFFNQINFNLICWIHYHIGVSGNVNLSTRRWLICYVRNGRWYYHLNVSKFHSKCFIYIRTVWPRR